MSTKTENAIASLTELFQRRETQFEHRLVEWAGSNLSPDKANELIAIARNSQSALDVRNELATFAAILTQPETTNLNSAPA
jgi:hypothetical protein